MADSRADQSWALSRFEELSRREGARTAILYAFDVIEHDGEDMRILPFLDRKTALARLLRNTKAGILFNEHIAEGPVVFAHAAVEPHSGTVPPNDNSVAVMFDFVDPIGTGGRF